MGYSPEHASTVPLILNLTTHRITAQFHVVFDDWFTTVDLDPDAIPDFDNEQWGYLFGEQRYQYEFDPDDGAPPALDNEYTHQQTDNIMRTHDNQADSPLAQEEGTEGAGSNEPTEPQNPTQRRVQWPHPEGSTEDAPDPALDPERDRDSELQPTPLETPASRSQKSSQEYGYSSERGIQGPGRSSDTRVATPCEGTCRKES
jgi:hypothetical protein